MNNISDKLFGTFEDSGVSPVIGVILMVAVTVVLVNNIKVYGKFEAENKFC